jgi:hypothetical protein
MPLDTVRPGAPVPPAPEAPPQDPPQKPPAEEEEEEEEAPEPVPASASGWYRVLTPVASFRGTRLGKAFVDGEAIVHTTEVRRLQMPGKSKVPPKRLVEVFVRDMGYTAEPIPVGTPPVPRSTLAAMGSVSAGVAGS